MDNQPGIESRLGDIPFVIVDGHNDVYFYWQKSKLKNSILFHIDGHSDMHGGASSWRMDDKDYYQHLSISNFIAPAFFNEIISAIYWLNPHSSKRKLQYMGSDRGIDNLDNSRQIWVYEKSELQCLRFYTDAKRPHFIDNNGYYLGRKEKINQVVINKDIPFILDIDIDAFCCNRHIDHTPKGYNGVIDYEKRVEETHETLEKLKVKPSLITLALSRTDPYVPQELSREVQGTAVKMLTKLYGKSEDYNKLISAF